MRSTGIVRKVDQLGRIVLPIGLRREMGIETLTELELYIEEDMLIYRVYRPTCDICGNEDLLTDFKERKICKNCIEMIKSIL